MSRPGSVFTFFLFCCIALAAIANAAETQAEKQLIVNEHQFWSDLLQGQKNIWTAPFHSQSKDLYWIAPIAGAAAFSFAHDSTWSQTFYPSNDTLRTSKNISYMGSAPVVAAAAGGLYFIGRLSHDGQVRAAGFLGLEALIQTSIVTQATKLVAGRERPLDGDLDGSFFKNGSSFPSGHSAAVWSLAAVLTEVYPRNWWVKVGAFSFASAVAVSRVTGENHYISDVIVGSTTGYLIGRMVVHQHMSDAKQSKLQGVDPYIDRTHKKYGMNVSLQW